MNAEREEARRADAEDAIRILLQYLGQDPDREGLKKTPIRVVKALQEMTAGYQEDPKEILGTVFSANVDQMVILKDIDFVSMCEHHMLPFIGSANVGYLPHQGKVVGLSKLARLVDCFARRLQLQEQMTTQIGEALDGIAIGSAVVVRATHSCMACRGVKKAGAEMVTSYMSGPFRDRPEARAEFLALCGK